MKGAPNPILLIHSMTYPDQLFPAGSFQTDGHPTSDYSGYKTRKMKNLKFLVFTFLVVIFASACRKDEVTTTTVIDVPEPTVFVEGRVQGRIINAANAPVEGAEVQFENQSVISDENGVFFIEGNLPQGRAPLYVKKEGYFEAYQTLSLIKEETTLTTVKLLRRGSNGIQATQGGEAIIAGQEVTVTFQPNSFVDADGNPYQGEVRVHSAYLDPTREDLQEVMPGNLLAVDTDNELQLLKTFGMVNVELEDPAGNPLQLSQNATIKMDVPAALLSDAPASIPLWHFDETNGVWLEEGAAVLENGAYVGEVAHFTWWNCDVPQNFIFLEGQLQFSSTTPQLDIRITNLTDNTTGVTNISNKGHFNGMVPKNVPLLLEVLDDCGNVLYAQQIGPFSTDTALPIIVINDPSIDIVTVSGTVENCAMQPLANGYAIMELDNGNTMVVDISSSGFLNYTFVNCGATNLDLMAIDGDELVQSTTQSFPIAPSIDLGTISACGNNVQSGLFLSMSGVDEIMTPCVATISSDSLLLLEIQADHNFDNGKVVYEFTVVDWTGNGDYIATVNTISFDTPDVVYSFDFGGASIQRVSSNEMPGDILHLLVTDVEANDSQGVSYSGAVLEIKALIVQ